MSRKQISRPYEVFNNQDISADATSLETTVEQFDKVSYDINWTSSGINGEIIIEYSNNPRDIAPTWEALNFGASVLINIDNGKHRVEILELNFIALRVRYVSTAGTGNLN